MIQVVAHMSEAANEYGMEKELQCNFTEPYSRKASYEL